MPYQAAILAAIEHLKDHQTGSTVAAIRKRIQDVDDDDASWKENLFQKNLKSLVERGDLVHVNGVNYKFSDQYMRIRTKMLNTRAESIKEHQRKMNLACSSSHFHAREEPPKETPKKKTVHAKVKVNETNIITVVSPTGANAERRRSELMDITSDNEEDAILIDESETEEREQPQHKKHLRIIPRKVSAKKIHMLPSVTKALILKK